MALEIWEKKSCKVTKPLVFLSSLAPTLPTSKSDPDFHLPAVSVVLVIMSQLAVTDLISVCTVELTTEKCNHLVHLLESLGLRCLTCADFGLMLCLADETWKIGEGR